MSSRFLYFCPPRLGGFSRASFALFIGHSLKAALTADLAALGPHLPHDLLNDGELDGLCGFNGFQENAPGVLDGIEVFGSASPLWHILSVARLGTGRQGRQNSNRPTTDFCIILSDGDCAGESARVRDAVGAGTRFAQRYRRVGAPLPRERDRKSGG